MLLFKKMEFRNRLIIFFYKTIKAKLYKYNVLDLERFWCNKNNILILLNNVFQHFYFLLYRKIIT